MSETINCPSCAAELDKKINSTKHLICEYCFSSIFLEDGGVTNLGKMAELIDEPSILKLGLDFEYRDWNFVPIGRVRYDYGRGWWDEWFVMDTTGETKWVSVDEGHIAIEEKDTNPENASLYFDSISVGESTNLIIDDESLSFTVTEKKHCKCIAAEGELPFQIIPDEEFDYVDLLSKNGKSATVEMFNDGTKDIFLGTWVDPFDIKACY